MKFIAANWKENPKSEKQALRLFTGIAGVKKRIGVQIVICPSFVHLEKIADMLHRRRHAQGRTARGGAITLGAQDVFWEEQGAYTSEIGPRMLKSIGVKYVIIGHSERRRWLNETDAMIHKKIKAAIGDGLVPILCVGEPLAVRKKGVKAAEAFVKNQLRKDLAKINILKNAKVPGSKLIIAYEPIWAIGTGRYDDPEDAQRMARFVKNFLRETYRGNFRFLYGGSVNRKNVADYVQLKEIDGALVGGASLRAGEFKTMIELVARYQ